MPINITQNSLIKQLTNQISINPTLVSPTLGVNIKLTNSTDISKFFVGTVTELIPAIKNADSGIYSTMKLDGTDNTGVRKTLIITAEQLTTNTYGNGYDKMFYTSSLQNTMSPGIKEEDSDDILDNNASIYVFDTEYVKLGNMVSFQKYGESAVTNGIISAIDTKGDNIKVAAFVGGRLITAVLTLIEATTSGFQGYVIGSEVS